MTFDRVKYEVDKLNLSNRTRNALLGAGIHRIQELGEMTRNEISKIYGLGEKGVIEIIEALLLQGVSVIGTPSQWMPIHTAPKDGSWILLYSCFSTKKPDYAVARWDKRDGRYWLLEPEYGVKAIFENPTHWMPLPYCPEAGQ